MRRNFVDRPNFFERLRTTVSNGWERLKSRVEIIKQETSLEKQIVGELVEEARERVGAYRDMSRMVWGNSGDNFTERLRNTARMAGEGIRAGWNRLREVVGERFNDLRERYRREGVVGATAGIVAEAIQTVGELPDRFGAAINVVRASIEEVKLDMIDQRQNMLAEEQNPGWREQYNQLDLTRDHVVERRNLFSDRLNRCQDRLDAMRAGRNQLVAARDVVVPLRMMPAAE